MVAPFYKIPLLIILAVSMYNCSSPPTPSPSRSERESSKSTRLEFVLSRSIAISIRVGASQLSQPHNVITEHTSIYLHTQTFWAGLTMIELVIYTTEIYGPSSLQAGFQRIAFFSSANRIIHCTPIFILGCGLAAIGSTIRFLCFGAMGPMFTFEIGEWVTERGSLVRESGILNSLVGKLVVLPIPITFLAVNVALLRRMRREDEALRQRFGSEWEDWARRVRTASLEPLEHIDARGSLIKPAETKYTPFPGPHTRCPPVRISSDTGRLVLIFRQSRRYKAYTESRGLAGSKLVAINGWHRSATISSAKLAPIRIVGRQVGDLARTVAEMRTTSPAVLAMGHPDLKYDRTDVAASSSHFPEYLRETADIAGSNLPNTSRSANCAREPNTSGISYFLCTPRSGLKTVFYNGAGAEVYGGIKYDVLSIGSHFLPN
ncbi:hypothetical protein DFP72DRAFT_1091896 [Ephemerocybe angulata]|uniref:Uncharacterized protein n=1 Tax=Ephemerocybe angulata TaxID=980116 RepID=A0A8H6I856_9AGAR|nr:hypothetical protein DFP72DRAFT_1091896 [Tulosesus angulatus]